MSDCLFCKIIGKEIKANIIYEDDHAIAFLDVMPRALGHTLVVPRHHAPALKDLPDGEIGHLFAGVKKSALLLEEGLEPQGFTIGINQGEASGQVVDHLHVHIMPRWNNDRGGSIQSVVSSNPSMPLEEILRKILNKK